MNQAQSTIAQTLYFLSFGQVLNHPHVRTATIESTLRGYKLVCDSPDFDELTRHYQPITGEFKVELQMKGFVEVPESAYNAAVFRPWELYKYREYITNRGGSDYLKQLTDWSGYDSAPTVQHVDPATPEENLAISRAIVRTVKMHNGIVEGILIFPYLNDVIAGLTLHKRLLPWWNSVACQGKEMPVTISATEIDKYAPYMAHIGTNESGAVISYYATDADD